MVIEKDEDERPAICPGQAGTPVDSRRAYDMLAADSAEADVEKFFAFQVEALLEE